MFSNDGNKRCFTIFEKINFVNVNLLKIATNNVFATFVQQTF